MTRLTAVLVQLEEWDSFDVNRVAQLTEGRPLEAVTLEVLHRFDLLEKLKLPREELRSFLRVSCLPLASAAVCIGWRRDRWLGGSQIDAACKE